MKEGKGKGYIGNKMSVNAHESYLNDEKPISKWRKKDIIEEIRHLDEHHNLKFSISLFKKLTLKRLKKLILVDTGWHHTGKFYNQTNFYKINTEFILNTLDNNIINKEIEEHQEWLKDTKEKRFKEKKIKEIKKNERAFKQYIKSFQRVTKYKTKTGLWKAYDEGRITEDYLIGLKNEAIKERRNELEKSWKNDPNAEWQYKKIDDDDFI